MVSSLTKALIPDFGPITHEKLSLKVASTDEEIMAAQRLRYDVFYKEMTSVATPQMIAEQREVEAFDPYCDHLLVIDNSAPKDQQVVGTYRILTQKQADVHGGFYTETEFDMELLRSKSRNIMEISRSCVAKPYRSQNVINLLWRGIAAYIAHNQFDYLIGVPSLEGTDVAEHLQTLRYLHRNHLASPDIRPVLRSEFANGIVFDAPDDDSLSDRRIFSRLTPLIKGYLRVGAVVGEGAFIDRQFNSIDVCIVWAVDDQSNRYFDRFSR